MAKTGWVKVGTIGVDAGICWIGDPCYILHRDHDDASIGKDWLDFCDRLQPFVTQFGQGLGVVVSTGYGDGVYPVFVRYNGDGVIAEAKVVFDLDMDN